MLTAESRVRDRALAWQPAKVLIIFFLKGEGGIASSKGRNTCELKPPPLSIAMLFPLRLLQLPVFCAAIFPYLPHPSSHPFSSPLFLTSEPLSYSFSLCLCLIFLFAPFRSQEGLLESTKLRRSVWWLWAFGSHLAPFDQIVPGNPRKWILKLNRKLKFPFAHYCFICTAR